MPKKRTIAVGKTVKHNTGNYESVEVKTFASYSLDEDEDMDAAFQMLEADVHKALIRNLEIEPGIHNPVHVERINRYQGVVYRSMAVLEDGKEIPMLKQQQ